MLAKEWCHSTAVSTRFQYATALTNTGGGESSPLPSRFCNLLLQEVLAVYHHVHGLVTSCTVYLTRSYGLCSNKCQPVECFFPVSCLTTQFVSVSGEGSTHPTELNLFPWQPSPNRKWSFCKTMATRWVTGLLVHKWCCASFWTGDSC